jgi:hypothetical protein
MNTMAKPLIKPFGDCNRQAQLGFSPLLKIILQISAIGKVDSEGGIKKVTEIEVQLVPGPTAP